MLTRILFLLSLALGCIILLTGAWTGSFTSSLPNSDVAFIAQPVPLDADTIGSGIDAKQLLQKALEKLDPKRSPWLKTKIRQTTTDAGSSFVAEGFLQRGPNYCARLQMTIGMEGRLLVVSDGERVAVERKTPGEKPALEVTNMLDDESAAKDAMLCSKSCGGPQTLLEQLNRHLQDAKLQTGLLQDVPVIQIKGDLSPDAMPVCTGAMIPVRHAYIYLDAKTLWPHRLEWHGVDKTNTLRLILRMEFLEPETNRELSVEECTRLFSYHPEAR